MKNKPFEVLAKLALFLCLLIPGTVGATGYTLTLNAQGSGTVTPDNTNNPLPAGVTITLTAAPNAGWYFSNWSGDTNGTVNPLQVKMNSNLSITGNFLAFPTYTVTLVTNGQGTIALSPPGGSYLSNSVVTATATPAAGWVFAGWTGGGANPLPLTLNTNVSLTGNFAELPAFDVQPVGVTNVAGSTVNFSAHSVGTAPLGYQWFFSGGSLSGVTTNTTLSLTNVSSGQAGNYWLVANNSYGSATSHLASLTLTNATGPTNVVNSPDEASLRAAIAIGGWVGLGFNGTITITNTISITKNVILDGRNVSATISGGNAVRLFYVAPGVTFAATNLTLANGSCLVTNGTADAGAIFNDNGTVALTACTLTNNSAQSVVPGSFAGLARGGAIFNNSGNVLLNQSGISNNAAIAGGNGTGLGGAIYNSNGSVTITGCNISSNVCQGLSQYGTGLAMGGAVFQTSGSFTIASSSFALNLALGSSYYGPGDVPSSPASGGALAANGGSLTIDHSQFFANTARGGDAGFHGVGGLASGGAIYSAATLTVKDSSFFGNQSLTGNRTVNVVVTRGVDAYGGAIYNSGTALLNCCLIYSNYVLGGNVIGYGPTGSPVNGGNGLGGGVFNALQLAATNCTIALNTANGANGSGQGGGNNWILGNAGNAFGGGIFNNTNATFIAMNLTIASNSCSSLPGQGFTNGLAAGDELANTSGTLRLHNSLIAYGTNSNAYGPVTDDGYNICSDGTAGLSSGSSFNNTDPQLAPLADNGGPTLTMALLASSPAIDFGNSAGLPNTDQRGYVRPFGAGPDMGAYEYGSVVLVAPVLNIAAAGGNVQLWFTATPPGTYRLQASTNLSNWTDLNTNGPFASPTNLSQSISQQGSTAVLPAADAVRPVIGVHL